MKYFLLILQMIPALIGVITALETAAPEGGKGSEKLAAVKEIMSVLYDDLHLMWEPIEKIVGILVGLFNKLGVFNKSTEEPVINPVD